MSTRAEELKVVQQRNNSARKRAQKSVENPDAAPAVPPSRPSDRVDPAPRMPPSRRKVAPHSL